MSSGSPGHEFEHLPLILRDTGPTRVPPAPIPPDPATEQNKSNRQAHFQKLNTNASSLSTAWKTNQQARLQSGLPSTDVGIPLLLQIDTSLTLDDLRRQFKFEVISEQEDGYVIVASEDVDLTEFQRRIAEFSTAAGSSNVAKIHELSADATQRERLERILTETLLSEWDSMDPSSDYICDVSVACVGNWEVPSRPKRNPRWKDETWARKENEWSSQRLEAYDRWDQLKDDRLGAIRRIVDHYQAEVLQDIDNVDAESFGLPDSFTLRLRISGRGLQDLLLNFPYIFEVTEPDDIETPQQIARQTREIESAVQLEPPNDDAPVVCVIDSGIQEEHLLIEHAIDKATSRCFLEGAAITDVGDYVRNGGHGTRVAGAVIHGNAVPTSGSVPTDAWVQNARVLDAQCEMPIRMVPASVIQAVVRHFNGGERTTRVFNHSINSRVPSRTRRMSAWAAEIDAICHELDVLVIQSAGNIRISDPPPINGVSEHFAADRDYPEYLSENSCRIANPAQSLQALTVGSIAYGAIEADGWRTFAAQPGEPSGFSRSGLGIWDSIKPEVVEYGGDYLRTESNPPDVGIPECGNSAYPELVRSTMFGGPALGRDIVGTSFAAPKVARIAARLQRVLPNESCLLYRALIVQSAQWPSWTNGLSKEQKRDVIRRLGYGVPDVERATTNTEHRVTFLTESDRTIGPGDCHIYQVPIPAAIRGPAEDFDIRIDVTLSYSSAPRRTRRSIRGYLATWVDWTNNRKGESLDAFLSRAMKSEDDVMQEGEGQLGWAVHEKTIWGIPGVKRSSGTVQKDWAIVKSNALPEDLCIAVRGHKGWSNDPDSLATYSLVVTFEIVGKEVAIYEALRTAVLDLQSEIHTELESEVEVEIEGG